MLKASPEDVTREFHIVEFVDEETSSEPARDVAEGNNTSSTGIPDLRVNALDPGDNAPSAGSATTTTTTEEPRVLVVEPPESPRAVEPSPSQGHRRWKDVLFTIILLSVLLLASVIINIVLAVHQSSDNGQKEIGGEKSTTTNKPSTTPMTTRLDAIRARGNVACGVIEHPGFSELNGSTGTWSGFEVDLCQAVGAAIFEEQGHVSFVATTYQDRFKILQSGQVDLLAAATTSTMERDLYEPTAEAGFTFSVPYLYNGLSFAGVPKYVVCAEQGLTTGNCTGIKICVQDGTSHVPVLKRMFPNFSVINLAPTTTDFFNSFVKGLCNVVAGEQFDLAVWKTNVQQAGYSGAYSISPHLYSKEPIALVTRDDDAEWSDFVNWVFLALLTAEKQSITQQTAQTTVTNPGPAAETSQLPFYHAVATVGNYAEMYQRHLESIVQRAPANQQNNGTTPLIYSFPFGNYSTVGPGPLANGTLEKILQRGYLLCGTADVRFFAEFNYATQEWGGFDVDYCRAISAAIFKGKGSTVFVAVDGDTRWKLLNAGLIDVISWDTTWNYERDRNETKTETGFAFSQPNFYTGIQYGGVPPFVACAENVDVLSSTCTKLKICVNNDTTTLQVLKGRFSSNFIVPQENDEKVDGCLISRDGNVIAAVGFLTAEATVREYYSGEYQAGSEVISRENLAIVTRQDDAQWSSFVNWIVMATFYADEHNITQATNQSMPTTNLFGENFTAMFQNAIAAVGSHSEILARNAGEDYIISAINHLNTEPYGPLHFPPGGLFGLI